MRHPNASTGGHRSPNVPPSGAGPTLSAAFSRPPSIREYSGAWTERTAAHLLRRTIVAPTHEELTAAAAMNMHDLVDRLLADDAAPPPPPRYVGEWMAADTAYYDSVNFEMTRALADELRRWWCALMITGSLSVRERMALFWQNHFPTDISITRDARFNYIQAQMLRAGGLGSFKELVRNVTTDKAMLWYLDGKLNKQGTDLNENYARELQELFTIGITDNDGNPNYTQHDVREAARVLTGWGFNGPGLSGTVECPPWYGHDPTDKVVYGRTITGREYGEAELDDLLDVIFDHEQTARYVIRKLYRFFVYTDAPMTPSFRLDDSIESGIIAPLAAEFRANNWSIKAVLRRLFTSDHFYDPALRGALIKSPVDLMIGAARSLRTPGMPTPDDGLTQYLHACAKTLGQWLYIPPGVQGWQFYRTWISSTTLPQRRAFTDGLIDGTDVRYREMPPGALNGIPVTTQATARVDVLAYARAFDGFNGDPDLLIGGIAAHLLPNPPSSRLLGQLTAALLQGGPAYEWAGLHEAMKEARLRAMMKFLMRSADYQLM